MKKASVLLLFCIVLGSVIYRIDAGPNYIFLQKVVSIPFIMIEKYRNEVNFFSDRLYGTKPLLFTKKWMGSDCSNEGDIYSFNANTRRIKKTEETAVFPNVTISYLSADKRNSYTFLSLFPGDLNRERSVRDPMSMDGELIIEIERNGQTTKCSFLVGSLFGRDTHLSSVNISNTGKYLMLTSTGFSTVLINLNDFSKVELEMKKDFKDISPNDKYIFVLSYGDFVGSLREEKNYILNIEENTCVELEKPIRNSIFSEENDYVIGYDKDYNTCIFSLADGKLVRQLSGVTVSRTGTIFSMKKDVVLTVCSDITSRKLINPFVNEGTFIEKTEISTGNQTLYEIPQVFFGKDLWVWDESLEKVYTIDKGRIICFELPHSGKGLPCPV